MAKIPTSENTETFIMRISPELKNKLNQLVREKKYGGSASAAIRILIMNAYSGK